MQIPIGPEDGDLLSGVMVHRTRCLAAEICRQTGSIPDPFPRYGVDAQRTVVSVKIAPGRPSRFVRTGLMTP